MCKNDLTYFSEGQDFICIECGKKERGNVNCSNGHYVCDYCHGEKMFKKIIQEILLSDGINPVMMAKLVIDNLQIPMLGCEHAWITCGSLMKSIQNSGQIQISQEQIIEGINRTRRQAIGAYCGLTGICGIAPAIGAVFSVILGSACPKDKETAITMTVSSEIIKSIAKETGPCCCKNFTYTSLIRACQLLKLHLKITLPYEVDFACENQSKHPHGCRREKCSFN
ncbi:MAG: hypothetical protein COA82_09605 [Alkaliphilus sp.]|nr:MAG: hypothetical protein COA82_09605 [Alkaliphilus sp.]